MRPATVRVIPFFAIFRRATLIQDVYSPLLARIGGNPDTFKDLDKLFNHVDEKKGTGAAFRQLPVDWLPSIDNTILIEKSISKCRLQPLNLLPITDYDESEYARTIEAVRKQAHQADNGNTGAGLLRLIFGCEASDFYAKYVGGDKECDTSETSTGMELDAMLLAVIGILSELQYVANVPVWIAAGGLKAISSTPSRNPWLKAVGPTSSRSTEAPNSLISLDPPSSTAKPRTACLRARMARCGTSPPFTSCIGFDGD